MSCCVTSPHLGDHSALAPCTRTTCVAKHSHEPLEPVQHHRFARLFQYTMIGAASTGVVLLKVTSSASFISQHM